jgi:uncharacterized protein (TIGR03083 family)
MTMAKPVASGELVAVGSHAEWMPLARDAYQRLADGFASLDGDDWTRPTPCEGWTVRDLGGHLVGALRSAARLRETISQQLAVHKRARRTGEADVDAMTAIQIERTADLTNAQLVAELQSLVEPAVRRRSRMPGVLRRLVKIHTVMGALDEKWTLDYVLGCILTRDAWLHRIDLTDALGAAPTLDARDREIIGDVAVEWVRRHNQPVQLNLTGPAGGRLVHGEGGDQLTLDAVEFCRVVSGRSTHPHPLLAQQVPF